VILTVIIAVSILQVILYRIGDLRRIRYWRTIIFTLVLISDLLILPEFFYPELKPGGGNCGMPAFAIAMAFWLFGGLSAIIIHTVYTRLVSPRQPEEH